MVTIEKATFENVGPDTLLVLERTYNDSLGITAKFNLDVLRRLNNEFEATFDLEQLSHIAIYNEDAGRIEMYLVWFQY